MIYTFEEINRHWLQNKELFEKSYLDYVYIFERLIPVSFIVVESLEGQKQLAENCSYLLLSKGINHSLSMYLLLERGLVIDSSLSARNAIETFLMLELFATDPTEEYFASFPFCMGKITSA